MARRLSPSTCIEGGHRYVTVHLLRCPHVRGWSVQVGAHEDDADDTRVLATWVSESGPFDDPVAVQDLIAPWLHEAILAVLLAE